MLVVCLPTALSADEQALRDRGVGAALGHQLPAPPARAAVSVASGSSARAAGQQLGDHLRVHRGAAGGDPADRVDELVGVEHPVLEQVADAAAAVGEQLPGVELLDVLGEHQHRQAGHLAPGLERRLQALVGERRRQPHVDHRDVGAVGRAARRAAPGRCRPPRRPRSRAPRAAGSGRPSGGRGLRRGQRARQLHGHDGRPARRAAQGQRPVEGSQPPLDAAQPGAAATGRRRRGRRRSTIDPQHAVARGAGRPLARSAPAVLERVGQQPRRPRSRRPTPTGAAAGRARRTVDRRPAIGLVQREGPDRVVQAPVGEHRRVDAADQVAQLVQRRRRLASRASASSVCARRPGRVQQLPRPRRGSCRSRPAGPARRRAGRARSGAARRPEC